jgi:signal transduction histidine kinase/CheY-like chemotaxis protein/AraC-like DNA-binding protein
MTLTPNDDPYDRLAALELELAAAKREIEIESALEKVRSRSQAMQNTGELKEIVKTVFDVLVELDLIIKDGAVGILFFEKGSKDFSQWLVDPSQVFSSPFKIEYSDHSLLTDINTGWENGSIGYQKIYPYEEKRAFFEYLFENNEVYKALPLEVKTLLLESKEYGYSIAFGSNLALLVATNIGRLLSQSQFEILQRLAKVFEQAYTRFLDLKKAEAQAREAQIEAALEKIRSKSLAMHQSDDLKGVVAILFEKLKELGMVFDGGAGVKIFKEKSNDAVLWVAAPDYLSSPSIVNIPFEEKNILKNPMLYDVGKARASGTDIFNKNYSFKEKNEYFNFVYSFNDYNQIPQAVRDWVLQSPNYTGSEVFNHHTSVIMNSYSGELITEKQFEILKRIGKVFEQTYIRFLDLQKAEAQTREALIETSLERVRARAMAMQSSLELREVAMELKKQIRILGLKDLENCLIHFYDESPDLVYYWAVTTAFESLEGIQGFHEAVPKKGIKIIEEAIAAFRSKNQDYVLVNNGSKITQWFAFMKKKSPKAYANFIESTKNMQAEDLRSYWSGADFSGGTLLMVTSTPPEETNRSILRRFANVFELAYSRFSDLKMAEALGAFKSKLYTNITHEFRTPLTVILGMAGQVMDNPDEHLRKGLKMIIRNGQNLLTLVNQMLDLSKLESGNLTLHFHRTDIVSFLDYLVDSFHSLAEKKDIQIHFIPMAEQLIMDFDEIRMQQIVSNLISNAIKFTLEGGHIYVSADIKNDKFILNIKDTGIGIAEADLPHIFDRFYQADDSHTRHGEGTGIGLAITHELVKLMEGTITVKSYKRKGAEFEVVLPIRAVIGSEITADEAPLLSLVTEDQNQVFIDENSFSLVAETGAIDNNCPNERPRVLIADDNEDVLAYVASCLKNDYFIETAKNGQESENMAFDLIPDIIVLDVMMPVKDGFEVCKALKNNERTSHIPIIMLTAKADLDSRLEGLEQGADAYLTKPFYKKELLLRIRKLLDLRRQLQEHYRSSLEVNLSGYPPPDPESSNTTSSFNISKDGHERNQSIPIANSLDHAFVIKVRKTIEAYLEAPAFDVEKLCHCLALSHSQVHRKLSALTGLSATHFIRYVRLVKAREMILNSGYSISAIGYDCGFNDPAYFSRIFKQEFGVSPQVWRDKNAV